MKSACALLASSLLFAACTSAPAPEPAAPAATGLATKPYANLAQMMQAIPFPASNIIFDAQANDPGAKKEAAAGGAAAGATQAYSNVYGGWLAVENAGLALQETSNLLLIPGRMCQNGKPAPFDQDDYKKGIQLLADAGKATVEAAKKKDLDAIVEVTGAVTEACSACHEKYRDVDDLKDRCTPMPAK